VSEEAVDPSEVVSGIRRRAKFAPDSGLCHDCSSHCNRSLHSIHTYSCYGLTYSGQRSLSYAESRIIRLAGS
jgi:hypothetical protein